MDAHTKGPWLTDMSEKDDLYRYVMSFNNRDGQPHYVCRLSCNGNANAEADARLIAAAPKLLGVLQEIVDRGLSMTRIAKARAVIAEATGEQA